MQEAKPYTKIGGQECVQQQAGSNPGLATFLPSVPVLHILECQNFQDGDTSKSQVDSLQQLLHKLTRENLNIVCTVNEQKHFSKVSRNNSVNYAIYQQAPTMSAKSHN